LFLKNIYLLNQALSHSQTIDVFFEHAVGLYFWWCELYFFRGHFNLSNCVVYHAGLVVV